MQNWLLLPIGQHPVQPASRFGTATGFRKAIEEYVRYFHFHDLLNSAVRVLVRLLRRYSGGSRG